MQAVLPSLVPVPVVRYSQRLIQLAFISLALAACANQGPAPQVDAGRPSQPSVNGADQPNARPQTPAQPQQPSIRSQAKRPSAPPAAQAIQQRALQQLQAGDTEAAIVSAERGLRIARNSPELLWVLARAYEMQQNPEQAAAFARQGMRYSRGSRRQDFERLLGRISN